MKYKIDISKSLDINNYALVMGNRVIFKSPNISIAIKDGGKDTEYELNNPKNSPLETINQEILDLFLLTNDNETRRNYISEHTVEKGIESNDIELIGDRVKYDNLMNRLKEYEKSESELLILLRGLYTYTTSKEVNINVQDIRFKLTGNKLAILLSKNDTLENESYLEYNIGDTTIKLNWKENGKDKVVQDDISLYIAKVKFKKLEKELNDLFELEPKLEFEQPDLTQISNEMSEFDALIKSFLTVGVSKTGFVNAAAFSYTFNNGVAVNLNESETIFIGRHFGMITISNKETKSSRSISIRDDLYWKSYNKPEVSKPLQAIYFMANELDINSDIYNRGNSGLVYFLTELGKDLVDKMNLGDTNLVDPIITFSRISDNAFKFIYTYNQHYKIELTYDNLLKATLYNDNNEEEGILISKEHITRISNRNIYKDIVKDIVSKLEEFRNQLNILHQYTQ